MAIDYHQQFHEQCLHCPQCQAELEHGENYVNCPQCQFVSYNNPAPCMTVMVIKDRSFLLGKRAIEPFKGLWDCVGGFVDAGESAEEAAVRELKEETGLDGEVTAYLGSVHDIYDGKPTLNLMYIMKVTGGQQPKPQDDIAELAWFDLDDYPDELAFKNTRITIEKTVEYILEKENSS